MFISFPFPNHTFAWLHLSDLLFLERSRSECVNHLSENSELFLTDKPKKKVLFRILRLKPYLPSNSEEECKPRYFTNCQRVPVMDQLADFVLTACLSSLRSGRCPLRFCLSSAKSFSVTLLALSRLDLNL